MESFNCICKFGGWLLGKKSASIILISRITSCHVFMIGPMWKLFCSCELPARHVSCCKYSKFCSLYRRAPRCLCFWLFSILETFRFEDENEIWLKVFSRVLKNRYRKILKISPGAYIFQRPFLRGLFLEGLIFGGAYLRREICVSKSIGLAL